MKELEEDFGPLGDILVRLKDFEFEETAEFPHGEFKKELDLHLEEFNGAVTELINIQRKIDLSVSEVADISEIASRLKEYPKIIDAVDEYIKDLDVDALKESYHQAVTKVSQYRQLFKGLRSIEKFMCSVCLESTIDTFLDPCGHTVCQLCSDRINKKCPYCRSVVFKSKKMIFS